MMKRKSDITWGPQSGVTLLEILVVLSIIMLVAAIISPRLVGYLGDAKSSTAQLQIEQLHNAAQLYYIDTGRYPSDAEGLLVLLQAPPGESNWNGPYLDSASALDDPWGRSYIYASPTSDGDFKISTLGRDGSPGGEGEDADLTN